MSNLHRSCLFFVVEEVPGFFVLSVFGGAAVGSEKTLKLSAGGGARDTQDT